MNLHIGDTIRRMRKSQDITQEELAAFFGVSFQSVSKWERGETYPDMDLLPGLAGFFNITVDELIGMERIRSEHKAGELFALAHRYEGQRDYAKAEETLSQAIRTCPNNNAYLSELALLLIMRGKAEDYPEALSLCEHVLENSTNEKLRSTTRAGLCFLYKAMGEEEKALALVKTLPHIWESREMLAPYFLEGDRRDAYLKEVIAVALSLFCEKIAGGSGLDELMKTITLGVGEQTLSPAEMLHKIGAYL